MFDTKFLNNVQTLGIVCTQWGDTGKGKFVDYFAAEWADIIARGTGGANAGHTIRLGDREYVFHLVPSGMLHKKINVIGSGVAFEPGTALDELAMLGQANIASDTLRISLGARLVLPQHVALDRVRESAQAEGKIGTTGRGMGPVYADHIARSGLVVNDLLNPDIFVRKLKRNLEEKIKILGTYDPELVRAVLHQKILNGGEFYDPDQKKIFNIDAIASRYLDYGKKLRPLIADTDMMLRDAVGKKRILLEGAQGNLLSVDYGTYPYVTSSDCSIQGLAKGVGIREHDVDLALGIVKAFYMTRVGEGPFPTELGGERSAEHCRTATKATEVEEYPDASLDADDEFVRGVAIRRVGGEYGATTGRPRRTGWLDLPLIRYSAGRLTGPNVILTKLDILDGAASFKICDAYEYDGPDYVRGDRVFKKGDVIREAVPDLEVIKYCRPHYIEFPGWHETIRTIRRYAELPEELRNAVRFVEKEAGVNVAIISVGPDREETIVANQPVTLRFPSSTAY